MPTTLTAPELVTLVRRVFQPGPEDLGLAILVDLPDEHLPDNPGWAARREMAADWARKLAGARGELGLQQVSLVRYPNVRRNNADLPPAATIEGSAGEVPFDRIFSTHTILIAPTELSPTAPLKLNAKKYGFRAATMPGFSAAMIPALRLDYMDINSKCRALKDLLDEAEAARLLFEADGRVRELEIDLRHRTSTASGGLFPEPGVAGNLPSGETYIVPYEGERDGDPSRTAGEMPLQLGGEILVYRLERNRVVDVLGDGPVAESERREIRDEPAYANLAELGLGVLSGYGIQPIGELLLDEKLGLHLAFGRSDHFGGQVGAKDFSSPAKVVHIDRVYIREVQPAIGVLSVDLVLGGGAIRPLMRNGQYV
ncbi:MAG: hypothetical protein KBD01_05165 [Acidobacteria bacterium]|nr:hypothetical protein [Acidobacteriota bacterium]